jgi:hypothetical protein
MHDSTEIRRDLGGGRRLNLVEPLLSASQPCTCWFFPGAALPLGYLAGHQPDGAQVLSDIDLGGSEPTEFWFSLVANYPSMTLGFEIRCYPCSPSPPGLFFAIDPTIGW